MLALPWWLRLNETWGRLSSRRELDGTSSPQLQRQRQ